MTEAVGMSSSGRGRYDSVPSRSRNHSPGSSNAARKFSK